MKRLISIFVALGAFSSPCAAYDTTAVNGAVSAKSINNVLHVGARTPWGGDIGAQINAAYAALPAHGGTIIIDPPTSGATYDFSTPIVFGVSGKIPRVEGSFPGGWNGSEGITLNYTPTKGAAITMDYATNVASPNAGIFNVSLINNGCAKRSGCGGRAIGIAAGNTNKGDAGASYSDVKIQGFDTGYYTKNGPVGVDQTFTNAMFVDNSVALKIGGGVTSRFISGVFVANDRIVVSSTSTGISELYFVAGNAYDNTGVNGPLFDYTGGGATSNLTLAFTHLETCGTGGGCTNHLVGGNFNLFVSGGIMESDATDGKCDWMINASSANTQISIQSVGILSSCQIETFVNTGANVTGFVNPIIRSPTKFTAIVGGQSASKISTCPSNISGNTPLCQFPYPVTFKGPITLPTVGVSRLPMCDSANIGKVYVVPNASSPTYLGTLSGGGTTYTLALCNGTNWVAV